jgi:hypothetical protein
MIVIPILDSTPPRALQGFGKLSGISAGEGD